MSLALKEHIKKLPHLPGVYLFKDEFETITYIGKAKDLRNRVNSYLLNQKTDWKAQAILLQSSKVDHIVAQSELEAMLLEAKMIQNLQPRFNVLLKNGQPFIYLLFTQTAIPELKVVRNKKQKGRYYGPFIEKTHARRVHTFLINTFRLKLCNKKIENGCLYYHLNKCSGSCRSDFNVDNYKLRLQLAEKSLQQGHKKFLLFLKNQIEQNNEMLEFEKSKQFHEYYQAFERVFASLSTNFSTEGAARQFIEKDIWILLPEKSTLFLYKEKDGIVKRHQVFHSLLKEEFNVEEYLLSYYRNYNANQTILLNFEYKNADLLEQFLYEWSRSTDSGVRNPDNIRIMQPQDRHARNVVNLARTHAEQYLHRLQETPKLLQRMFKLSVEPITIDCFDISHKQGTYMVGSCIRFNNGEPDKNSFRKFHIKTVNQIDDYASLREVVSRRYRYGDYPDLVLIDGGKGQLNAVKHLIPSDVISLAKREETIFSDQFPEGKKITANTYVGQLLIALRDYAHHFAISFHRSTATKKSV